MHRRSRGFTLIETLVALVVAATAASVILAMTRGMYQRAEQQRSRGQAISRLTNDVVRLGATDWRKGAMRIGADRVEMVPAIGAEFSPELVGRNFAVRDGYPLPPIEIAFTPVQEFVMRDRQGSPAQIRFLGPSLPHPVDATIPIALPAGLSQRLEGSTGR